MQKTFAKIGIAASLMVVFGALPIVGLVSEPFAQTVSSVAYANDGGYDVSEGDWSWNFEDSAPVDTTDYSVSESDWSWNFEDSAPIDDSSYYTEDQVGDSWTEEDMGPVNDGYGGYSGGSYGGSSGGGFSMPRISYPSTPTTFYAPTYYAPRQQQQQYQQQRQTSTTNNNCVNNSCNTNINNIDNSINGSNVNSAVVYPIQSAPIAYPVQYVQPVQPQPSCTITINRYNNGAYGQYGNQLATLTWTSNYATSGYVSPSVGSVSSYGSMTVYPVNGQVYTMTVYGPGGTATCATPAQYAPVVYNPAPATPYVSLSQIPYTGLDMSPLAQAMYWIGLVAFAGAAAYLVLYFQGGSAAVIAGLTGNRATRTQVTAKIQMPAAAPVASSVVSPIQVAPVAAATRTTSTDTMKVISSKGSEAPRIVISRA